MNKDQRKTITEATATLEAARAAIEAVRDTAEEMATEERDKFDGMPEGLQQGERGRGIEAAAEALSNIAGALDSALDSIDEATGEELP